MSWWLGAARDGFAARCCAEFHCGFASDHRVVTSQNAPDTDQRPRQRPCYQLAEGACRVRPWAGAHANYARRRTARGRFL